MKYIVIDRDGTLIRHVPYLHEPSQVQILPTVAEGLAILREAGCKLFMHTNQSGIGRGWFSLEEVLACNAEMLRQLGMGEIFLETCICPEHPDEEARLRKPSPRFGLDLLAKYGAREQEMCYLGDNVTDMLTAKNIGCAAAGVDTGGHDLRAMLRDEALSERYPVFATFLAASRYAISWELPA